jgi:hypothetical protein
VDAVFIDGDHEYDSVKADYQNVGRHAKVVAFHDCFDTFVEQLHGGVPKFWLELKEQVRGDPNVKVYEFHMQSRNQPYFGICALVRLDLAPEFDAAAMARSLAYNSADLYALP